MAGKSHARHSMEQDQYEEEQAQQQAPSPQAPAPSQAPSPMVDQLNQLATLHQQGALSDSEFAAAKAKLIGS